MQRPRRVRTRVLLLVALVATGSPATRAEPEQPDETWRLATVVADPSGRASAALERALEALEGEDWDEAAARLVRLRRDHGDQLVRAPASVGGKVPLHWPLGRVVESLLPGLPDAHQNRLREAWRGPSEVLANRARLGDEAALEALGEAWALTPPGRGALRTLALGDLEAGRFATAAARLERWLRLAPEASRGERAAALLELVDARAGLEDEWGLDEILTRWPALAATGVSTATGRVTPALRARQARARLRLESRRPATGARGEVVLPPDPVVLWTMDHERSGLRVDETGSGPRGRPTGAAAADGDHVILNDGRSVKRIDAMTGRVAWQFPPPRPSEWNYAPSNRYAAHDVPVRTVTVAGDIVLAVLGDPVGSGSFGFQGAEVRTAEESRESRTRLVALDRLTGGLRWASGRADEEHPVLGDLATGCHSPPLIVEDAVYALFVRRRGVSEIHLARLDLATGRPAWVAFLAAAESGRSTDVEEGAERFREENVRSGPWGARPAHAEGEICVLPHAGFAAGVDATSGRVAWLRVLPRFSTISPGMLLEGFSARNEPLAHAGGWILAPLDCPRLVALEQGTGRWLWSRDPEDDSPFDPWHHVLGVDTSPRGGPWLKLCDREPALLPVSRPHDPLVASGEVDGYGPPGRPYDAGSRVVLLGTAPRGATTRPVLVSVPWDRTAARRPGDVRRLTLPSDAFPRSGDVYRVGRIWVVVGTTRTGAVTSFEEAMAWVAARQAPTELEPGAGPDVTALEARLRMDVDLAVRALEEAVATGDASARQAALGAIRDLIDREARGIEQVAEPLLALIPTEGAGLLADLVLLDGLVGSPDVLVPLLDHWVEVGRGGRVVAEPGLTLRADLYAGQLLRVLGRAPAATHALAVLGTRRAAAVDAARTRPEAELREAIRRAAGTDAAGRGRRALKARLVAAGRYADAAALAADLRLDPGPGLPRGVRERHRWLATAQQEEATLVAQAGQTTRARRLLLDLERWAPGRPWRLEDGQTAGEAAAELGRRHGWRIAGRAPSTVGLGPVGGEARDAGAIRSLVVPGLVGPGAERPGSRVVVLRGLTQEVWDLAEPRRLAAWPGTGRGWFGGTLQEVASWLPDRGVVVTSLVAGEPADRAGLREGDWIVGWDGKRISSASRFMHLAAGARPGESIPVDVRRGGRRVLERFVPGSRPDRDGSVVRRDVLHADASGRVLVPGRLDLAWIDLDAATRTPLWSWTGTGVVNRVTVVGGRAIATIRRFREEDSLVAVDLETGDEMWRASVGGTVLEVEATGSAIVATTADPAGVVVLDAFDGAFRARLDVFERRRPRTNYALTFASPAAVVHGRVWGVIHAPEGGYGLRIVNTTTGAQVYEPLEDQDLPPLLAGDGVVAIATGTESLAVLAPDPLTGRPRWRTRVGGASRPDARDLSLRRIDANSRLFVVGDRLWITRAVYGQGVTVEAVEIDVSALGPDQRGAHVPVGRVLRALGFWRVEGLGRTAYLLDARATPEGIILSAGSSSDPARRTVQWMDRYGRPRSWPAPAGEGGGVLQIRRHPPSRVGTRLALPVDEGVMLVPLASGE